KRQRRRPFSVCVRTAGNLGWRCAPMKASPRRTAGYALAGMAVLLTFVLLGRYALRQSPPDKTTTRAEPTKHATRHTARPVIPEEDLPTETPVSQLQDSAVTNAAVRYRQAFALYNTLSHDEQRVVSDWRTNVDASV